MTTPRPARKTYKRPDLGIVRAAQQLAKQAAEIELGWLGLREHLHAAGWPATTPEDDRRTPKPRDTVKCACGSTFPNAEHWQYHADETGHRTRLPVDDHDDHDRVYGWRCTCGHTFTTDTDATAHSASRDNHTVERVIISHSTTGVDYADPTGDLATGLVDKWHRDLAKLQDLRQQLEHVARTLVAVSRPYRPDGPDCVPICSRGACDQPVESRVSPNTGKVTYRGMEQIAGMWVPQVGIAPTCARHGRAERRENAA